MPGAAPTIITNAAPKAIGPDGAVEFSWTRDLPDGSKLAAGQVALEGSGVTNEVKLLRPDGVVFIMHVSNRQSPKGLGPLLGAHPPLTVEQLVSIATSDRW